MHSATSSPAAPVPILQLLGVGKRFRSADGHERTVLDSVDFTLHDG